MTVAEPDILRQLCWEQGRKTWHALWRNRRKLKCRCQQSLCRILQLMVRLSMKNRFSWRRRRNNEASNVFWKIEFGFVASKSEGSFIISSSSILSSIECSQPNPSSLVWISNFSCPFAPWPPSHSSVSSVSSPMTKAIICRSSVCIYCFCCCYSSIAEK